MEASAATTPGQVALGRERLWSTDQTLIDAYRAGDEEAFRLLFERHGPRVHSIARSVTGCVEDAHDVVQDVFSSLASRLHNDEPREFRAWLGVIARNAAIDHSRRRRALPASDHPALERLEAPRRLEARADLSELVSALREIPAKQRSALLLKEMGGYSYAEIAEEMGVEEWSVRGLISRARESLKLNEASRDLPCSSVQAMLRGETDGRRRPPIVRRHLRACPSCSESRRQARFGWLPLPLIGFGGWRLRLSHLAEPAGIAGSASVAKVLAVTVLTLGAAVEIGGRVNGPAPPAPSRGPSAPATGALRERGASAALLGDRPPALGEGPAAGSPRPRQPAPAGAVGVLKENSSTSAPALPHQQEARPEGRQPADSPARQSGGVAGQAPSLATTDSPKTNTPDPEAKAPAVETPSPPEAPDNPASAPKKTINDLWKQNQPDTNSAPDPEPPTMHPGPDSLTGNLPSPHGTPEVPAPKNIA